MNEKVKELVADLGAKSYKKGKPWKGYEVFIPQYSGDVCIGLPYVVLAKGEEARICTDEEALDYLGFENAE